MGLVKVVSGGQTGVDQAALFAAKAAGLATGGWAPKGWKTLAGPDLRLRDEWGLREHPSTSYPPRTYANVRDSDATLRLALSFKTPGEICTARAIRKFGRKSLDVPLMKAVLAGPDWMSVALEWLRDNKVETLNVAGNAEGTRGQSVYVLAVAFLLPLFLAVKGTGR